MPLANMFTGRYAAQFMPNWPEYRLVEHILPLLPRRRRLVNLHPRALLSKRDRDDIQQKGGPPFEGLVFAVVHQNKEKTVEIENFVKAHGGSVVLYRKHGLRCDYLVFGLLCQGMGSIAVIDTYERDTDSWNPIANSALRSYADRRMLNGDTFFRPDGFPRFVGIDFLLRAVLDGDYTPCRIEAKLFERDKLPPSGRILFPDCIPTTKAEEDVQRVLRVDIHANRCKPKDVTPTATRPFSSKRKLLDYPILPEQRAPGYAPIPRRVDYGLKRLQSFCPRDLPMLQIQRLVIDKPAPTPKTEWRLVRCGSYEARLPKRQREDDEESVTSDWSEMSAADLCLPEPYQHGILSQADRLDRALEAVDSALITEPRIIGALEDVYPEGLPVEGEGSDVSQEDIRTIIMCLLALTLWVHITEILAPVVALFRRA